MESGEPLELVPLKRELDSRRASLSLLSKETQLQVMGASMDIRGLEALYALRVEQNAHVNSKKELSAEISALKKKVSALESAASLATKKLGDAEETLKRLKKGLPTLMCIRCKTLTTEDREKNDTLRIIDACTKLKLQMQAEASQLIDVALLEGAKERCECGFVRVVGQACGVCKGTKENSCDPERFAPS